jgi:hypothetical protein
VQAAYNPNFHYAPVVAIDEDEGWLVTFENWAVNDPAAINDLWGFRVYACPPKPSNSASSAAFDPSRSYHARLTSSGGYGNVALTFAVRL